MMCAVMYNINLVLYIKHKHNFFYSIIKLKGEKHTTLYTDTSCNVMHNRYTPFKVYENL